MFWIVTAVQTATMMTTTTRSGVRVPAVVMVVVVVVMLALALAPPGLLQCNAAEMRAFNESIFIEVSSTADVRVNRGAAESFSVFDLRANLSAASSSVVSLEHEVASVVDTVATVLTAQASLGDDAAEQTVAVESLNDTLTSVLGLASELSAQASTAEGARDSLEDELLEAKQELSTLAGAHSTELSMMASNFSRELEHQLQAQAAAFSDLLTTALENAEAARSSLKAEVLSQASAEASMQVAAAQEDIPAPGEVPTGNELPTCDADVVGRIRFKDNSLQLCIALSASSYVWRGVDVPRPTGLTKPEAAASCKEALASQKALGLSAEDGPHWIKHGTTKAPVQVWCDMTADSGGWTLVGYAGSIRSNKQTTTGTSNFFPLFGVYGTYDADAPNTRSTFSLMKDGMFSHLYVDTSEVLAKRTTVPDRQMIFPVANVDDYNNNRLPPVDYLRVTLDGSDYRTRENINIFPRYGCQMPCYTGYDDNWCSSLNCDSSNQDDAGSFGSKVSHRAMLYWEILDDGYTADQWFHGTPLNMHRSTGPDNAVQDVEFYLREVAEY